MTEMSELALAELDSAWGEFIVGLRMRDGLNENALERLHEALKSCESVWKGKGSIPRLGANILVDIFQATEGAAYAYEDEQQARILEASFYLQDLVRQCVGIDDSEMN